MYWQRGSPAFRPELLLRVVLLEILDGRCSPAQWQRDVCERDRLKYIGRGITPRRSTMYEFRDRAAKFIDAVHQQLIEQAIDEQLVDRSEGVIDGTATRACASRHQLLNEQRLQKRRALLEAALSGADPGEPSSPPPRWMAKTPSGRLDQAARFERSEDILGERLKRNARKPKDKRLPRKHVLVSTSDPESPLGRDKEKVFGPIYTPQFVVAPGSYVVLSWDVFAQATDAGTLAPMIDRTQAVVGGALRTMHADAGYSSLLDLHDSERRSVELFAPLGENSHSESKRSAKPPGQIPREQFTWLPEEQTYECPAGHRMQRRSCGRKLRHDDRYVQQVIYAQSPETCGGCPLRASCLKPNSRRRTVSRLVGQELLDAHAAKMETECGRASRRLRGAVVERAFGDGKRYRGLRQRHGRGLQRVRAEVGLLVVAQNALRLYRLRLERLNTETNTT